MSKEAMKLALEALEFIPESGSMLGSQAETKRLQAITAMREALAEQPAAGEECMRPNLITRLKEEWNNLDPVDPLRGLIADAIDALAEAQPSKPWVGLTDEEIIEVIHPLVMADMADEATDYEIARAIEAKLREKNA